MKEKIERLEEEIRKLHFAPTLTKKGFSDADAKQFYDLFWNIHVKPVVEYSKQMAEKYNADFDVVWLGAILHDLARLSEEEPHDEIGSKKAYDILIEKGFSSELAEKVKNVVLTHRCKNNPPQSVEEKIVASADAMAHFLPPFYLWVGRYTDRDFTKNPDFFLHKVQRDYDDKIFFADEKNMIKEQYNVLKKWFSFKI